MHLRESRDRIILINSLTQGMIVIEGSSSGLDSLLRDLMNKDGQPPASKASIEAMPSVEIDEGDEDGECVICLEEFEVAGVAKAMPCKHKFHGKCIEKWLGIHGSCPVCRYKMPVDEEDVHKKSGGGGEVIPLEFLQDLIMIWRARLRFSCGVAIGFHLPCNPCQPLIQPRNHHDNGRE
ncbi:hypothetical protein F0562_032912 [Nyssa sinensis]|uniref:RING-type E3 ubiquitin transferase n=1 Tax=Nyssa sinensis TaxID=561372 RepID=A0A5J5AVE2_9ASTE|nr:hypothetical protein F0562_032912 [Nyssa sinensis]